jgi:hypothetical protein
MFMFCIDEYRTRGFAVSSMHSGNRAMTAVTVGMVQIDILTILGPWISPMIMELREKKFFSGYMPRYVISERYLDGPDIVLEPIPEQACPLLAR